MSQQCPECQEEADYRQWWPEWQPDYVEEEEIEVVTNSKDERDVILNILFWMKYLPTHPLYSMYIELAKIYRWLYTKNVVGHAPSIDDNGETVYRISYSIA